MTITIMGIQGIDFKADDGKVIKGKKLHCLIEDEQGQGFIGRAVKTLFIADDAKFQAENAQVGKTYTAYGEPGKKALAVLIECK